MKILVLLFVVLTNVGFASDRVGNGGDVVFCNDRDRIYVLDEFENSSQVLIGGQNLSYEQKVYLLMERVKEHFPVRHKMYVEMFEYFNTNVKFLKEELSDIEDTEGSVVSHDISCVMIQAAYFTRDSNNNYQFHIYKPIWNLLSNDQKAILVMHEIVYAEAVGLGIDSSFHVREVNRMIFSGKRIDPVTFDAHFTVSMLFLPRSTSLLFLQLRNAFSEAIALNVLKRVLPKYYGEKNLKASLLVLKERFLCNSKVLKEVNKHLKSISDI